MTGSGDLVLGIDASTTACKAVVWTLRGEVVAQGRAGLPLLKPRPLWHEQPAAAWWTALCDAARGALKAQPGIADRIAALCIAPQRETFVPVDAAGEPLRHAIVWMDERSGPLLPRIAEDYGAERVHQETGKPLSGNLALPKILWLRENEPQVFAATARYLDVAGFLHQRLTGEAVTGWGNVDPMGLFDLCSNTWDAPLLDYLGVEVAQMPSAYPPGAVIGAVTAKAADGCGLRPGLPVVAGVGDGQAGGLGANIAEPGCAYLNLGTAVIAGAYAADYVVDRAFRTMTGGVPGSYSLETVLLGGTYTVAWFVETLAAEAGMTATQLIDRYDATLDDVPPGAEGLMVVPYWNSAMNPYWDAQASGIVVGWRGVHTRAHLYRAILEGIAFEQRLHTEGVGAALGERVAHYVAMGGGARSDRWRQIIADITGRPVYRAEAPEAAALGAGILAAAGAGLFPGVRDAAAAMTRVVPEPVRPDAARHADYTQRYEGVYRHLFPSVQPYLDRLTELSVNN